MEDKLILSGTSKPPDQNFNPSLGDDLQKLLTKDEHQEQAYGSIPMGKGDVPETEKTDDKAVKGGCTRMSTEQKFTFVSFCFSNFCVGCFFSVLSTFFPEEAIHKDVSQALVGLIIGSYELLLVCFSPLFGTYLTSIGAKLVFCAGLLVGGATMTVFGFVDVVPPGAPFIGVCLLIRVVQGIAAAASSTATFAIMANTFPDRVAQMFGILELFMGFGMLVGSPVGGALYQAGGFRLPFLVLGILLLVFGVINVFILPRQDGLRKSAQQHSLIKFLRLPIVLMIGYLLLAASFTVGVIAATFSVFLTDVYHLEPVILGLVFVVQPAVYALSSPAWGYLADIKPEWRHGFMVCGYIIAGVSFAFIGPPPILGFHNKLWAVIVCFGFNGLGIGTCVVAFGILTDAARDAGYEDNLATFGLISGVFNMFFSLGAFLGPLAGGAIVDALGFAWTAFVTGCFILSGAFLLALFTVCETVFCHFHISKGRA